MMNVSWRGKSHGPCSGNVIKTNYLRQRTVSLTIRQLVQLSSHCGDVFSFSSPCCCPICCLTSISRNFQPVQSRARQQTSAPDHVLLCSRQKPRYSATVMFLILPSPCLAPHLLLTYINIWWATLNVISMIHRATLGIYASPCVVLWRDNFIYHLPTNIF